MILAALLLSALAADVLCETVHSGNYLNKNIKNKFENENYAKEKTFFYPSGDQLAGWDEDSGSLFEVDEAKKYKVRREFNSNDGYPKESKEIYDYEESNPKIMIVKEVESSGDFELETIGNPETTEGMEDKFNFIESKLNDKTHSNSLELDPKGVNGLDQSDKITINNGTSETVTENVKDNTTNHSEARLNENIDEIVIGLKSKLKEDDNEEHTLNLKNKGNLLEQFNKSLKLDQLTDDQKDEFPNASKVTKEKFMSHGSKLLQRHIHDFKKNLSECLKEVQIEDTAPVKVLSPRFESPIHANCLVACVLRKNNIIDGFNIDRENLINLVLKFYEKNSKAVKKLTKNVNKCIELARKYKNQCEVAAALNACTNDVMGHMKSPVSITY